MRALEKTVKPKVLVDHEDAWRDRYVAAAATGDNEEKKRAERWRHEQIREALRLETARKCAYCESSLGSVSFAHVEHIVPKSLHPELAHEWVNLTLACEICNVGKDKYWSAENPVLNPYIDDISASLTFLGDFVGAPLGDVRGSVTINLCGLNRLDLIRDRTNRLIAVKGMLDQWHSATGVQKDALAYAIRLDAASGEFTASVYQLLRTFHFPVKEPVADPSSDMPNAVEFE
ncbi:HNH endonuclease [Aeromicrobium yanjiei]|uniref:HNH nuclease domain-containing protein n=1 Tax=Aeromicrobium yanjiei TaxID=2662028 RepID=A0A5Q2MD68_9ACTN|nr:HNH endonuclease [Aeromicrobium yanjiei]QGG41047.1 hypothetical protein GEV26_06530 [Aeromicrobium yanjiei]